MTQQDAIPAIMNIMIISEGESASAYDACTPLSFGSDEFVIDTIAIPGAKVGSGMGAFVGSCDTRIIRVYDGVIDGYTVGFKEGS